MSRKEEEALGIKMDLTTQEFNTGASKRKRKSWDIKITTFGTVRFFVARLEPLAEMLFAIHAFHFAPPSV